MVGAAVQLPTAGSGGTGREQGSAGPFGDYHGGTGGGSAFAAGRASYPSLDLMICRYPAPFQRKPSFPKKVDFTRMFLLSRISISPSRLSLPRILVTVSRETDA